MAASPATDLELMRASMLLDSDPAAAARAASGILAADPRHEQAQLLLATACRRLGDAATAIRVLEALAAEHPGSPVMQLELGRAYAAAGRGADATAAFRAAVGLDASFADAWRELAAQCFAAGDDRGGDIAYGHYSRLARSPPELTDALVAFAEERLDAADALVRERLRRAPEDVAALRLLADIANRLDDFAEAERCLAECLRIAPGYAAARHDLARVLNTQQKNAEALPLLDRLLAAEPANIDYLSLKAQALRLVGRSHEAIALIEQAVIDHPQEERAWLQRGHLLRAVGQQARAIESYRRATSLRSGSGAAYWSLVNLKTVRLSTTEVAAIEAELASTSTRGSDRMHLEFTLGKALEDDKQYAASFEHYSRANELKRATIVHDPDAADAKVGRSKDLYTAEFFATRAGWGSEQADPIFIVGLPRSGSTLLEQILASHSQVEGTHELNDLPALALEVAARGHAAGHPPYPGSVAPLGRADVVALAARYIASTRPLRALGRERFVDKMLGNFDHLGLIHLMFPNASIIDARRHPLACGFSCFKQLFARGIAFSYDLEEMGRFYRGYAELLAHFDAVLPGRVYRVHYEQLVADPEREIRRLLQYCRLPFEEQCLRFYENPRIVQTISSEQVRQPIYTGSVDQWRYYEPWLGPLKAALGGLAESYPAA